MTLEALIDHFAAAVWLARARLRFARHSAPELFGVLSDPATCARERRPLDLHRAARAIRRLSRVLPFRTDCFVQALAAKMWLDSRGAASRMKLAADTSNGLAAHVWMLSGDLVVTGGTLSTPMTDFELSGAPRASANPTSPRLDPARR